MTEIVLERVSCERSLGPGLGKVRALSDIDLRIGSGEVLTLLGPSGSGKTTLLRVIAGLDRCSAGSIRFGADRVERLGPERRRTAFVFQDPALYPDWTVGRHLESGSDRFSRWLPGWWSGRRAGSSLTGAMSAAGGERTVPASGDIAAWLGLAGSINRKPHQLSGGERHRVALGRAIVREPAAFLFDEPFSALDPATRWELREAVAEVLARSGKTAIFVTHDEREASAHGGRIGVLIAGRLRQVGDWDELVSAPADLA
ncbi:MAG TPA: ABC transporter ATP-binding protein, partial [Pirellulaceae bacterium]|nr:ABC transporter ATP-binding protein [Pirellulaceae bacterium]